MCRWQLLRTLTFAAIALPVVASAERLPIKAYTTADGLANNVVHCIVRDSRGFMWFCTREGLSRFDGSVFTTYGIEHGLPSAVTNDLLEARDGTYWVATSRGVARMERMVNPINATGGEPQRLFRSYIPSDERRAQNVTSLLQDRDGNVWLGTQRGLYRAQFGGSDDPTLVLVDVPAAPEINCLMEDAAGTLWIGTSDGLYLRTPEGQIDRYTVSDGLPGNFIQSLMTDRDGRIWLGTRTGGLALLALVARSNRPTPVAVYTTQQGLPTNWVNQVVQTFDGTLFVMTTGGLVQLLPTNTGSDYRFRVYGVAQGLSFPEILSASEDRNGNLWIGSVIGAAKILPDGFSVFGAADGVATAASLLETREEGVLVMTGTHNGASIGSTGSGSSPHGCLLGGCAPRGDGTRCFSAIERATGGWERGPAF